jgi:hypothetical protein
MFFKNKSHTQILREAGWDPERIPDSDILFPSILAAQRLSQVKRLRDPATGKMKLEETELVRKAKKSGMSEDEVLTLASSVDTLASINAWDALKVQQVERCMHNAPEMAGLATNHSRNTGETTTDYLERSKWDVFTAINSDVPVMGLSFLWLTTVAYMFFISIENELREQRNPLYVMPFENVKYSGDKRMALVLSALKEEDEECLRVMANVLERLRAGFVSHLYWKDVETVEERLDRMQNREESQSPECIIM